MPLGPTQRVTPKGAAMTNSNVSGFSILQAESAEAVTKLLQTHPHFMAPGAAIEVVECMPMPGM
jgi:hypothetical protein